jgi:hypothetical protein
MTWSWERYLNEKDERKRWDMLQENNRLSYDHVDDWLMSLFDFLWRKNEADRAELIKAVTELKFKEMQLREGIWIGQPVIAKVINEVLELLKEKKA